MIFYKLKVLVLRQNYFNRFQCVTFLLEARLEISLTHGNCLLGFPVIKYYSTYPQGFKCECEFFAS